MTDYAEPTPERDEPADVRAPVAPDEFEDHLEKDAIRTSMGNIVRKCGYAAGLN